jgi:hypothetical protein
LPYFYVNVVPVTVHVLTHIDCIAPVKVPDVNKPIAAVSTAHPPVPAGLLLTQKYLGEEPILNGA